MDRKRLRLTKTKYQISLSKDDRLSIEIQLNKGIVIAFSVNYYSKINKKLVQVWRADTAYHGNKNKKGKAHFHQYYRKRKQRFEFIGSDFKRLLTESINYIKDNYRTIKENYLLN